MLERKVTETVGTTVARGLGWTAILALVALALAGCRGVSGGATPQGTPVTAATPTVPPLMKIVTPTPAPPALPGTQPAAPATTQSGATQANGTYIVQPGDTLYVIAAKLNVSVQALVAANGITNPSSLQVGQILKVPKPGAP